MGDIRCTHVFLHWDDFLKSIFVYHNVFLGRESLFSPVYSYAVPPRILGEYWLSVTWIEQCVQIDMYQYGFAM